MVIVIRWSSHDIIAKSHAHGRIVSAKMMRIEMHMHAGGTRESAPQSDLCLIPEQADASNGSSEGLHIIVEGQTNIGKVLYLTEMASGVD